VEERRSRTLADVERGSRVNGIGDVDRVGCREPCAGGVGRVTGEEACRVQGGGDAKRWVVTAKSEGWPAHQRRKGSDRPLLWPYIHSLRTPAVYY
jgi:hypothetical protein